MTSTSEVVHVPSEANSWLTAADWARLDALCDGVFDCPHTTPTLTPHGPFVARSQDVRTGIFRRDRAGHVSEKTYSERIARAEPRIGDLLFSREGTYFGNAAEVPTGVRVCLGQRMVLIRPKPSALSSRFLRFWLNSPLMAKHMLGFKDGSVAERLNMPTIRALPVPRLSLKTQSGIAAVLGALDDKIELNRSMNETLEAAARALFKDWFVDFGPTRAKMEGRSPYLAPEIWSLFPVALDEDGKPEGWSKKPLSELFEIIGGGTPKTSVGDYWGGTIPWFSVGDTSSDGSSFVNDTEKHITPIGLQESSVRLVPADTTIISARGTVGNIAIAAKEMTFNQSCYALRGKGLIGNWLVYLTAQHMVSQLQALAHGSVFSTITRQTFDAISLALPDNEINQAFDTAVAHLFEQQKLNGFESVTLRATRDFLLPKLMSGEIKVKDAEEKIGETV
jgi:type I restriction enzyme S subunit